MKKIYRAIFFLLALSTSTSAISWVYSPSATIIEVIQWQNNSPVYFKLSNGIVCYVPENEKNVYSLILTLYAAGNKAHFHCHEDESVYAGVSGYRLHRVIAVQN